MSTAANFFDERKYPCLVDLLRCEAEISIGEHPHMNGFARIRVGEEVIETSRMTYESVNQLLEELEALAEKYINANW
jgi:hypothetical protein